MNIKKSAIIVILNTIVLIFLIETISFAVLQYKGVECPFFINKKTTVEGARAGEKYRTLDPHLGYAHGENESYVKNLSQEYTWISGFVVYEKSLSEINHPVILALGGSTTDGVNYGYSWPEELSKILKEKGQPGSVVNGGTGGYSTNQELLKLIRDGLEFQPDIVISYSGINDRGKYSQLPYPMVSKYQKELFETLAKKSYPKFLPSSITLFKSLFDKEDKSQLYYTFGMKSKLGHSEQYKRNIQLMNAVAQANGAEFVAFIQPFAFFNSIHSNDKGIAKGEEYKHDVLSLYKDIMSLPNHLSYVHDATQILETHTDVYKDDGVHLKQAGDKVVARYIYSNIEEIISEKSNR